MAKLENRINNGPLIIALDLGTSSARAVLFDSTGRPLPEMNTQKEIQVRTAVDGAMEIDAREVLSVLYTCLDSLLQKAGDLCREIRGVAMCMFVSNVLGLGADDQPITPVYTYADTRPAQEVKDLRQQVNEVVMHQRTGVHFHSSYLPARFLWLEKTQPGLFERVKKWVSLGEYLQLQLFGNMAASYSAASWTGLLNYKNLCWDDEILKVLPINRSQLSPLIDVDEAFCGLREPFATRWPVLRDIAWFPAMGDGAAANIGSGCTRDDRLTISMGTSSAARAVIVEPPAELPYGLWCYRVDRKRMLLGGAMSEGGSIFGWLRKILLLDDSLNLEKVLMDAPTDGHGLTFLPLITGERCPGWIPEARGAISGLSIATTPVEILQAGMEGVCCRIALVVELLKKAHPKEMEIVASGGAVQGSPAWQQMLANVLGKPIRISQVPEATARGAALLAFEALGVLEDAGDVPDFLGYPIQPDLDRHTCFLSAMQRQRALYDCVISVF